MKPEFISFAQGKSLLSKAGKGKAVAFAVTQALKLSPQAAEIDRHMGGLIARAMSAAKFKGKKNQVTRIVAPKDFPY